MKKELGNQGKAVWGVIKTQLEQALAKPYKSLSEGFVKQEEAQLLSESIQMQKDIETLKLENRQLKDQLYNLHREHKSKQINSEGAHFLTDAES